MNDTNERSVASAGSVGEPVAWAVAGDYGDYAVALFTDKASAQTEADRRALVGLRQGYVVVPLYRHPPVTEPLPTTKRAEVSAEPAAWYVRNRAAGPPMLFWDEERAKRAAFACGVGARPLYQCQDSSQKNLTLTDAEREAVERAVDSIASTMPYESQQGLADWKTLRGLLRRLGGVR